MTTCGEALVRILEGYGVDLVFGIPGVHTVELYRGLSRAGMRHVSPRHEQGAGFMADGYARATGRPGVCFVITGPGLTNIATAMGQALRDSVPMLVISSVNRTQQLGLGEGRLHELADQRGLAAGVSISSNTLMCVDALPQLLARAFGVFASQRPGPVHIEIPLDVLAAPADHLDTEPWALPSAPAPAPEALACAIALLKGAERPLVAIGGGAVGAAAEVARLAEMLDAPVVNTTHAKGVVPRDHALAVGGSGSCQAVREAFRSADVVLAVGTELSETDYDLWLTGGMEIGGTLIRVDIEAAQLSRNFQPGLAICSDARQALAALCAALANEPHAERRGRARAQELRDALHRARDAHYAAFFSAIEDSLPGVIIAGDSTQPTYYASLHYETSEPRRYFHSASGFGTLGYALPAAVGAKLGRPERPVVALVGDGGAQFSLAELASAVQAKLSLSVLVWHNEGYGEIRQSFAKEGVGPIGVDIQTPDFLALARSFGCAACRADDLDALRRALREAREAPFPTLIEVRESEFTGAHTAMS
ncbi:MAG TPA: 5-guanidino-2-oxopentanoate decarboxylase [Myxococcota bacterium]